MGLFEKIIPYFLPKHQVKKTNIIPMNEIKNIICFSNTAIGDTLFNTPIFKALKKSFPDKKITVVLNPSNYSLFKTNPHIDEIMLYNGKSKSFFQFLKKLKLKKPKLILILHSNEPQATPLAVLSGAKYILKIPNINSKFNLWHTNQIESFKTEYVIYQKIKYLNYLGLNIKKNEFDIRMDLFLKKSYKDDSFLKIFQKEKKLIAFQIGASNKSRMWFNDKWIELGKKLLKKYPDICILLTGSKNERILTNEVENGINDPRVKNIAGNFSLTQTAKIIKILNVLITPDTGPLHIAAALKTPTIALYAVMDHIITNPAFDTDIHLYIQKPRTCEPCITRKCKFQKCMLQIDTHEVFTLCNKLLRKQVDV